VDLIFVGETQAPIEAAWAEMLGLDAPALVKDKTLVAPVVS
jgi:hypothetical protein